MSRDRTPAATFTALIDDKALDLPLPGSGATLQRWLALAALARVDLSVARLAEGHTDAAAIVAELGRPPVNPGERWGVWAAEPPQPVLTATQTTRGWQLNGVKPWCSGAHTCTHALVTARTVEQRRLFAVDLTQPGVSPVEDTWHAVGMSGSDSGQVSFADASATPVGEPGQYVDRPGFWHGAIGVAACWYGGAGGVADVLRAKVRADPHALAHLGAVDATLYAAQQVLRAAAAEIDGDPSTPGKARALRVRAVVEAACTTVLDRVGRATGAGPLGQDAAHAQRVADLTVYLRQSHAEEDLAGLGTLVRDGEAPGW